MGGLDRVVNVCKSTDTEALRHCASALANVAIFGGNENQEAMIQRKVPSWLFPLAFRQVLHVQYQKNLISSRFGYFFLNIQLFLKDGGYR